METPMKAHPGIDQARPCNPDTFFEDIMKDLTQFNPACCLFQTLNPETMNIRDV